MLGKFVCVARQAPTQDDGGVGHCDVWVQIEPVGQALAAPIVQGTSGGGEVGVAIQAPPQGVLPVGQVMVGVQVEPVGQPVDAPTVQGI